MLYRDCPTVEVTRRVEATPAAAWAVVSDITVPARFSPELQSVAWVGEGNGLTVGRRFRGTNSNAMLGEWTTECQVVEVEEGRRWVWEVENGSGSPSATWGFEVEPTSTGALVRQWGRMGPAPSGLTAAIVAMPAKEARIVAGRIEEWRAGMSATLDGIAELLAGRG